MEKPGASNALPHVSNRTPGGDDVRISVVIAVYNGEQTIARAIRSVLNQSFAAHEVIVVDDGSTDDTQGVVKSFDDNVKYLYQENAGVSKARNAGVDAASGEWVAFLDADDWYLPDRLLWHAEWITQDPDLDFLTGDQEYRRPDGTLIKTSLATAPVGRQLLDRAKGSLRVVLAGDLIGELVQQHIGDTPTLTVRRETFLQVGGYPGAFAVSEDVHLLIRLAAHSRRIGVICRPLAVYCVHEDSATRSNKLRAQQQTVAALTDLRPALRGASKPIRDGLEGAVHRARLDLAVVLLRRGQRLRALCAVLPSFSAQPRNKTLRDILGVVRGLIDPKTRDQAGLRESEEGMGKRSC